MTTPIQQLTHRPNPLDETQTVMSNSRQPNPKHQSPINENSAAETTLYRDYRAHDIAKHYLLETAACSAAPRTTKVEAWAGMHVAYIIELQDDIRKGSSTMFR